MKNLILCGIIILLGIIPTFSQTEPKTEKTLPKEPQPEDVYITLASEPFPDIIGIEPAKIVLKREGTLGVTWSYRMVRYSEHFIFRINFRHNKITYQLEPHWDMSYKMAQAEVTKEFLDKVEMIDFEKVAGTWLKKEDGEAFVKSIEGKTVWIIDKSETSESGIILREAQPKANTALTF